MVSIEDKGVFCKSIANGFTRESKLREQTYRLDDS
jgi:hypothetical protein